MLTRVVVDERDPAFLAPSKFIGPVYSESQARALAEQHGWTVKRDGDDWRRVVASPQPQRIVQLRAIERLVDAGFLVVCTGGGGIPVVEDTGRRQRGVEAVIDKDLASSLLANDLGVETLVLATDVAAVYRRLRHARAAPDHARHAGGPAGARVRAGIDGSEGRGGVPASSSAPAAAPRSGASTKSMICSRAAAAPRCCRMAPELEYGERKDRDARAA